MDVVNVLHRIHVVQLPDDGKPARIYNLNENRVHLKGQTTSDPKDFQGRIIQYQTLQSSEHPYRMWEFWFVDSPRIRLRHFMKAVKANSSNQTEPTLSQSKNYGIYNNTYQTTSYAQQRGDGMQVNGNSAKNDTVLQAMHVQSYLNQALYYGQQQQHFPVQYTNQPQQFDQLPANRPLYVAQPTVIDTQPYDQLPSNVLQIETFRKTCSKCEDRTDARGDRED